MRTPNLTTFIQTNIERRERQVQTSFPAKVISWATTTNTVKLEPQFTETWVTRDGQRIQEETPEGRYIENVPVLFPRSGSWAITFPIEAGSYGLVTCTKYSLDVWRNQGNATDPGDLRRFTMSGAVFHPVNLYPDASNLVPFNTTHMVIGDQSSSFSDFVALAEQVKTALNLIKTHTHPPNSGGSISASTELVAMDTDTGSTTVKATL